MTKFLRNIRHKALSYKPYIYFDLFFIFLRGLIYKKRNFKKFSRFSINSSIQQKGKTILIPLIETQHAKLVQMLLIGVALKLKGARVIVLVCDQFLPACEIRSSYFDHEAACKRCKMNIDLIIKVFNLELIYLEDLVRDDFDHKKYFDSLGPSLKEALLRSVDESVIRHFYGNLFTNENHDLEQIVREKHLKTACIVSFASTAIEKIYKPDIVIGYMLVYSAWEPMLDYFKLRKIRIVSVTSHFFDKNAQMINGFDLYTSDRRFQDFLKLRIEHDYESKLNNFLQSRIGSSLFIDDEGNRSFHSSIILKESNNYSRRILFCPNLHWDYGMDRMSSVFQSIEEWVMNIVKLSRERPEINFIIRPHPVEVQWKQYNSLGIYDLIKIKYPNIPNNLTIYDSGSSVSSYSLFEIVDGVVVMNGTIGLEAMLLNQNVIICGSAPYSYIENVCAPKNISEYEEYVFGEKQIPRPDREMLNKFAYFYFLKTAISWNLTPYSMGGSLYDNINIESLEDLFEGKNNELDHICRCILDEHFLPENWG